MPTDTFDIQRDSMGCVAFREIDAAVRRIVGEHAVVAERVADDREPELAKLLSGVGQWSVVDVLKIAACVLLAKGAGPDDRDAAVVRAALCDFGMANDASGGHTVGQVLMNRHPAATPQVRE